MHIDEAQECLFSIQIHKFHIFHKCIFTYKWVECVHCIEIARKTWFGIVFSMVSRRRHEFFRSIWIVAEINLYAKNLHYVLINTKKTN